MKVSKTVEDAERYRWLRDCAGNEIMRKLMKECRPDEWDKLIALCRAAWFHLESTINADPTTGSNDG